MNTVVNIVQNKNETSLTKILSQLMSSTNTSISQLCRNTGLAHTTIKRMCTEPSCNPTLTSIEKVADFFGITLNQLIGITPLDNIDASYTPKIQHWD